MKKPIWQKSFYDHVIRNENDFYEKLNYIHNNPLKHKITDSLEKYSYNSYQNYNLLNNRLIKLDKIN